MLFELERYDDAAVLFEAQVELDRNDSSVSEKDRADMVNNLDKMRSRLQESSESAPSTVP